MDPTKTRIWNANALGLALPSQAHNPQPSAQAPKTAELSGSGVVERSSPARDAATGAPRPTLMHATRIMPIEKLLPHAVRRPAPPDARRSVPPPPPRPRSQGTPVDAPTTEVLPRRGLRYGGHAVVGMLTLIAVGAWWQWPTLARVQTRPLIAKMATQPTLAREVAPPVQSSAPAPERAPEPNAKRSQAPAALARQAIDLVIAGDYGRAEAAYLTLARDQPQVSVYREAARILAERHKD
jgi:hypothetical protein